MRNYFELEDLFLEDNQLHEISSSVCKLNNLNYIGLYDNPIKQIPDCISKTADFNH